MPVQEERKLMKSAGKAGLKRGSNEYNAYVYGTLQMIEKRRKLKHQKMLGGEENVMKGVTR